jgi:hypothetical protein
MISLGQDAVFEPSRVRFHYLRGGGGGLASWLLFSALLAATRFLVLAI